MRPEIEQALSAFKKGEVEHGLKLLERTVMSFGMKVCGHREDAEDTAQEVLLKLLPHVSKFESPKAFSVWLYTVARNRCLMSRRHSKFAPKEHLPLEDLMPSGEELAALAIPRQSEPENIVLRKENAEHVRKALDRIPPQYRLILVLHDMEGLGTSEVAEIMSLREGTVRVRLHRGRLALRKELAHREHRTTRPRAARSGKTKPKQCRQMFAALSDYLDESLDPEMCEKLEKHLAGCEPCENFLAELQRTIERCRTYDPECDPVRQSKIKEEVLAEYRRLMSALQQSASNPS